MTTYFGVSAAHDSSLCFYKDGKIQYFMKEERKSLKKRDKDPIFSFHDYDTEDDIVFSYSLPTQSSQAFEAHRNIALKKYKVSRSYDYSANHHLIHANLAFYNSGFDKALVFVIDRNGSFIEVNNFPSNACRESESVFIAEYPNIFTPIYKNYWINDYNAYDKIKALQQQNKECTYSARSIFSIVKVYETATSLIFQDILENGKTMGLSAYGNKNINFDNLFTQDAIAIDHHFGHEYIKNDYCSVNLKLQKYARHDINEENYSIYADYAWQVQKQTQEALSFLVNKYISETNIKNVCITGGYGLNVVANHYLISQFPDINFFFEPLADDSGNSIGAAMKAYRDETLDTNIYKLNNTFFNGSRYSLDFIKGKTVSFDDVAGLLASGKSVAVYQGLAEAGPRALGNRSILFDSRDPDAKRKVNEIKKREWYRPFAGMVLEEDAGIFFEMGRLKSSPYMTISFPVKESAIELIPGVVHVDKTCRLQTINKDNLNIFSLLNSFKTITGIGVILNTSFNLAGQPLVETPKDAIRTLLNSSLDFIWFPEIQKIVSKDDFTETL